MNRDMTRTIALVGVFAAALPAVHLVNSGFDRRIEIEAVDAAPSAEESPGSLETARPASEESAWTALPPAPLSSRFWHSVTWTGREVIVWGGVDNGGRADPFANDGAAYDPSTGRWRKLAEVGLQSRHGHAAVWTGQEVIVWGGFADIVGREDSGAMYLPDADVWRPIRPFPAIRDPVAVWTGDWMLVWGLPRDSGPEEPAITAAYDPAANAWTTLATSPLAARGAASGVWTGDELIVWGGWHWDVAEEEIRTVAEGAAYDPATDTWRRLPPAPLSPRFGHSVVWTGSEMIVWGGTTSEANDAVVADGAAYDPATDAWRVLPASPLEARYDHTAVWTGRAMLVWGGHVRVSGSAWRQLADAALYGPVGGHWKHLPDAPTKGTRDVTPAVWADDTLVYWGNGDYFSSSGGAALRLDDGSGRERASRPDAGALAIDEPVALRLVAAGRRASIATIDLQEGRVQVHPARRTGLNEGDIDGLVVTAKSAVAVWQSGVISVLTDDLDGVRTVIRPDLVERDPSIAPALRLVPTGDGDGLWVVQPRSVLSGTEVTSRADLIDLSTGEAIRTAELPANSFAVAATGGGVVLNTWELYDTGAGWTHRPGSERVHHLDRDGDVQMVGDGSAIAATSTAVLRLICADPRRDCGLWLTDLESGDDILVPSPGEGVWRSLGGPSVPTEAGPLDVASPDDRFALVGLADHLDVNGKPRRTQVVLVDLHRATAEVVHETETGWPTATWSRDGRRVVLLDHRDTAVDIVVIDPQTGSTRRYEGVIPDRHWVMAAGPPR